MAYRSEFYKEALKDPRVKALLDTISYAEGTSGPEGYRTMYTGKLFDTSRGWVHPDTVNTGGGYSSTAAGKYQMLTPTYNMAAKATGTTGFSPEEQDLQAVYLLDNRKALEPLLRGEDVGSVINMLAPEWASLPTRQGRSYYNQPVKDLSTLTSYYGQRLRNLPAGASVMQVEKPLGQDLQAAMMGDASVGRGSSTGTYRKAGNKLLGLPEILSGAAQGIGNLRNALLQLSR